MHAHSVMQWFLTPHHSPKLGESRGRERRSWPSPSAGEVWMARSAGEVCAAKSARSTTSAHYTPRQRAVCIISSPTAAAVIGMFADEPALQKGRCVCNGNLQQIVCRTSHRVINHMYHQAQDDRNFMCIAVFYTFYGHHKLQNRQHSPC